VRQLYGPNGSLELQLMYEVYELEFCFILRGSIRLRYLGQLRLFESFDSAWRGPWGAFLLIIQVETG
jgi:hypothetical protein